MNSSTTGHRRSTDGAEEHAFATALERAQGEFLEMPGLQLTEAQAARLWSSDADLCSAVLAELVQRRFLVRTKGSRFARP